jgi:hypothetical protein
MKFLLICILVAFSFAVQLHRIDEPTTFSIKFVGSPSTKGKYETCEIVTHGASQSHRAVNNEHFKSDVIFVDRFPQFISHDDIKIQSDIVEIFAKSPATAHRELQRICGLQYYADDSSNKEDAKNDELETILLSGPANNRIGVVMMGDGYTVAEKKKHHDDMTRLHNDMFRDVTFRSYLPLFNVWSVYRASAESGVGTHGRPKNTAYKLYRQGTELRGLFPGNTVAIRSACRAAPVCTFPTVIGNDDYYGGLGGEFVISTRSLTTGTMVLRHEQGHNYGRIGEEYDGGGVYSGANFAATIAQVNEKWGKWLSGPAKIQESENNINAYVWKDLAAGPVTINFKSTGAYKRWYLGFSVSGCPEDNSIEVLIDGVKLPWKSQGLLDRSFYDFHSETGFSNGNHVLTFRQFRSQNEQCLMRNMTSTSFCEVCEENLWLQFFSRMNCIDEVKMVPEGSDVVVSAVMVKIGQFREGGSIHNEKYTIKWSKGGVHDPSLDGQFSWKRASNQARGSWTVEAKYTTDEIRYDPQNRSVFTRSFIIQ